MKILFALICSFMGFTAAPYSNSQASVVAQSCYVYTSASFENILQVEGKDVMVKHGDNINVVEEVDDFVKVEIAFSETAVEGFIYRYYITYNKNEQETYPVFNAQVENKDVIVYDLEKNETSLRLKKGQQLYLYSGYDKKQEWTAVCFVQEDASLYYGFVKTIDISPDGVNPWLITGVVIITSCVTIVLLLVFMKKNKDKKNKKKLSLNK